MKRKLNFESRIKDIYQNPIGHDVIKVLLFQMDKSEKYITNPMVSNLKIKTLARILKKRFSEDFFISLLNLLNLHIGEEIIDRDTNQKAWWKEAVFYQIYPKTFNEGKISGITDKLDYVKVLGADAVWLSPVYDSPDDDNGYDIRDYYKINESYGTMEDFDYLLKSAHEKGIRIIMDLVVNHTSDEHHWFKEGLANKDSRYRNFYFLRDKPNNWTSFFSGDAWNYYEDEKLWGLHLFSKKQMDLNWDNEELRAEIIKMIRWWLEKGVDGFRLDVINYISKEPGLPDGNVDIGKMIGFQGIEHYFYGPNLHRYLSQIRAEAFEPYNAFSVGETPGIGLEMGRLLTSHSRKELDMIFSFDHLENPGHTRFDEYRYNLNYLKKYYIEWMENYSQDCWMSLFYENHDNPRMISKVDQRPEYKEVLAGLLCVIQMTLKGTPFIYQGQEMGLVNAPFTCMAEIKDIESINLCKELEKTMSKEEAFRKILAGTRDHARMPINWNDISENVTLDFYKEIIKIRKKYTTLIYGNIRFLNKNKKDIFTFEREDSDNLFYIECNISDRFKKKPTKNKGYRLIKSNYNSEDRILRPYEANIYILG